jgi:SAM-dependent methyltransferase
MRKEKEIMCGPFGIANIERKELLMGCGSRTTKDLYLGDNKEFTNVIRLDNNAEHKPDIVHDLAVHPLPFADGEFDEIHAYEVLEHLAYQGDYEFFFKEFTEYWRILKPGGLFFASCPAVNSEWAWGDPSHKRIISKESLVFLSQAQYKAQVGVTKMSDFRYLYKADFQCVYAENKHGTFYFILKKLVESTD